jgi:predicted dehydrogenase
MMPAAKREQYLIVGFGSIGQRHLRNLRMLRPNATVALLRQNPSADRDDLPAGIDHQFTTLAEALAFKPRAAIVAGPATTHTAIGTALADAGAHLFIEKPLADCLDGIPALLDLCRRRKLTVMVGYNLRFLPSLKEVRRILESGALGRLLSTRAEVGQYLPDWRPDRDYRNTVTAQRELGGGVILELSHELDYLYWLFGLPRRVFARGGHYSGLHIDVEDVVEVVMEYLAPAHMVSVHMDMIQRVPVRTCRFVGEEGTLTWDGIADRVELFTAGEGKWTRCEHMANGDRNRMYVEELAHFLDCIEVGNEPLVDGEQGSDVLRIIHAVRDSIRDGCLVELQL